MTFTDDDLKRLKEMLRVGLKFTQDGFDFPALIARLEAAEAFIARRYPDGLSEFHHDLPVYTAWRKAAGK